MRNPYPEELLKRAIKFNDAGVNWREVAPLLDVKSWRGLYHTCYDYKRGVWTPQNAAARSAERDRICEECIKAGIVTIGGVAEKLGVSDAAAAKRLLKLGLDKEMRRSEALDAGAQKLISRGGRRIKKFCQSFIDPEVDPARNPTIRAAKAAHELFDKNQVAYGVRAAVALHSIFGG